MTIKRTRTIIAPSDIPSLTPRAMTNIRRANKRKRPSKKKVAAMLKKRRATIRAKQLLAAQSAAKPPKPLGCQHPRARGRGTCACNSLGELVDGAHVPTLFTIPGSYIPDVRHANQPELPRPQARLCLQHKFLVETHMAKVAGEIDEDVKPYDYNHRRACPVCCHSDQLKVERVIEDWLSFTIKGAHAARELGVSDHTFARHCYYYRLDEKRADKPNTRKLLLSIAEQGIGAKVSAKDAIAATAQLSKERGDVQNVNMRLAVKDFGSMSDAELAALARQMATKLEAETKGIKTEDGC